MRQIERTKRKKIEKEEMRKKKETTATNSK